MALGGGIALFPRKEEYPLYPAAATGQQLTELAIQRIEEIKTVPVITPELIQPLQPYAEPPVVTTTQLFLWSATQQSKTRWQMSNMGITQSHIDVVMHMRDNMRASGYGKGELTLYWLDGNITKQLVYA